MFNYVIDQSIKILKFLVWYPEKTYRLHPA